MQTGDATHADGHGSGLAPREIHVLMIAVMSGMFLAALDGTVVITALPAMVGDLGNLSQAPWIQVGFLLTQTIATPIIGKLSDIYGRKPAFQVTIVVFLVASGRVAAAQTCLNSSCCERSRASVPEVCSHCRWRSSATSSRRLNASSTRATSPARSARVASRPARRRVLRRLPQLALGVPRQRPHRCGLDRWWCIAGCTSTVSPRRARSTIWAAVMLGAATAPLVVALLYTGEKYGWRSGRHGGPVRRLGRGSVAFVFVELRAPIPSCRWICSRIASCDPR